MKIGIMGAKGDPWHWMHILVAEMARVQRGLDRVYLVTAGQPVDKQNVTDKEIRHETITSVIDGDPYLIPSRVEIDREGPSYMADTLRHFKKEHGDDVEIDLIIGDDRAPTIAKWHEPEAICALATIVVAPRLNARVDKDWLKSVLPEGARFDTLEIEFSSSFIRKQREMGRTVRWLVPPQGVAVVEKHNLYAPKQAETPQTNRSQTMTAKTAITEPSEALLSELVSILDDDLYKFSMAHAVLRKFPNTRVTYRFTDRKAKGKWTPEALAVLQRLVNYMSTLALTAEERAYCETKLPWINRMFWDWLAAYRYDPAEVRIWLDEKNNLQMEISGLWGRAILWEVKLMYLTCAVWYAMIDTNWSEDGQDEKMEAKAKRLFEAGAAWGDFGTRRRRNRAAQERVVRIGKKYANFTGTSNVYLAMKYGVNPLGTMAHEWIMAHSALYSLRHANRYALQNWNDVYQGNLGTALPDTFGTEAFLRDFDGVLARLFDSVRHDSGDPFEWAEKMIAHYTRLGIDWKTKPLGFTDGNTDESAIAIHNWVKAKGGRCWFGIGTSMSNDYGPDSSALSIVIKLSTVVDCDGSIVHVVKLSDNAEKATGDVDAIRVAKWTHLSMALDTPVAAAPGTHGATASGAGDNGKAA